MRRDGFSLIESLIGLTIFLFIILASLEFFGTARRIFFRLRDAQEDRQAVSAALDRIRTDLACAGRGLAVPMRAGIVEAASWDGAAWTLRHASASFSLAADIEAGRAELAFSGPGAPEAGRSACVFDPAKGEAVLIESVGGGLATLAVPLFHSYKAGEAVLAVIQETTVYLDASRSTLRRKVNASSAQPLLEEAGAFELIFDSGLRRAVARVALRSSPEDRHEIHAFAKNIALAGIR